MADIPSFEVPAQMRDLAETNVDRARQAFDGFMGAAKRAADTMQDSTEQTRSNMQAMYARGFDYAERNVHAAFDHAQKLARASTPMEMMQLQAEFVRGQFEAMQEQAKAFGGMAQGAMQQGAERAKAAMQQGADEARRLGEQGRDATQGAVRDAQDAVERSTS